MGNYNISLEQVDSELRLLAKPSTSSRVVTWCFVLFSCYFFYGSAVKATYKHFGGDSIFGLALAAIFLLASIFLLLQGQRVWGFRPSDQLVQVYWSSPLGRRREQVYSFDSVQSIGCIHSRDGEGDSWWVVMTQTDGKVVNLFSFNGVIDDYQEVMPKLTVLAQKTGIKIADLIIR